MHSSSVFPVTTEWRDTTNGRVLLFRDKDDGFMRYPLSPAMNARQCYGDSDSMNIDSARLAGTTSYAGWSTTAVGVSTLVQEDVAGGSLILQSSAVENEGIQMQHDGECFLPDTDKDIWFECTVASNDVTETDFFAGLCLTDTSIVATNPADLIGFWSLDGDASIHFEVSATAGAGAPVDTLVDFADDTPVRLGFHVQGNAAALIQVTPYINGVANATAKCVTVANIPAVEMAAAFALLNGEAVANHWHIYGYSITQFI